MILDDIIIMYRKKKRITSDAKQGDKQNPSKIHRAP